MESTYAQVSERIRMKLNLLEACVTRWLARRSVAILRVCSAGVFLGFGLLKVFPGVSLVEGRNETRRFSSPPSDRREL